MGMYDTIRVRGELPGFGTSLGGIDWQTKSLGCDMDTYEIAAGALWKIITDDDDCVIAVERGNAILPQAVDFYGDDGKGMRHFRASFYDGRLQHLAAKS